MIQLDRISHAFGGRNLFDELSWQLHPGARIGLVGPNGAGKTTLFRILSGDLVPDSGRVIIPRDATIGLLPQDVGDLGDMSALEHVLGGSHQLLADEEAIADLRQRIEEAVADNAPNQLLEKLTAEMADREDSFRSRGGYTLRSRAAAILEGMGFPEKEHGRHVSEFSGGRRVRIVLARLLLQRPDVLLMDEPTNHLDVPSVEWLEGFLSSYEGTVVVISHDRYFLDRLVTEIAGLEPDGLHVNPGNWNAYMTARAERIAMLDARKLQQDKQIKETERFIERFRAKATKARQVQSRVKQLEKVDRITTIEDRAEIRFRFPEATRSGKLVSETEHLSRSFGDLVVFRDVNLNIERDERIALVGPNGAGKSTLLRILAGDLDPSSGTVRNGHNVIPAYFAQHSVDALDLSSTVLREMERHATDQTFPLCRSILGAFLFSGEDVEKRVSVLSGGERNRVALARMLLRPANFLLLDEPTNHLDMSSRDVLQDALIGFGGTVVFVSHDRYFINAVATRVIHIEDGTIESYPGDYEYYRYKRQQQGAGGHSGLLAEASSGTRRFTANTTNTSSEPDPASSLSRKDQKRIEAQWRNDMNRETRQLKAEVDRLETEMAAAERRISAIESELADPSLYESGDGTRIASLQAELGRLRSSVDSLMESWEAAASDLESSEARWNRVLEQRLANAPTP